MSRSHYVSMQRVTKEELYCKTIVGRGLKLPDVVKEAEVNSTSNKDENLPIHENKTNVPIQKNVERMHVPIERNPHLENTQLKTKNYPILKSTQVPIHSSSHLERNQELFERNQHLESTQGQIIKNPSLKSTQIWNTLKCHLKRIQI